MHGNCKCFYHWIAKLLVFLAWISAVLFWWTGWKDVMLWETNADGFFKAVVVFILLAFSTKFCGCCRKMMHGGMISKNCECKCPTCEDNGPNHIHENGHRHM